MSIGLHGDRTSGRGGLEVKTHFWKDGFDLAQCSATSV